MLNIEIYWVCWVKSRDFPVVVAGPFVKDEDAHTEANRLNQRDTLQYPDNSAHWNRHHVYTSSVPVQPFYQGE